MPILPERLIFTVVRSWYIGNNLAIRRRSQPIGRAIHVGEETARSLAQIRVAVYDPGLMGVNVCI